MLSLLSDLQFHRACSLAGGGICFILRLLSWLLTRLTDCSRSRSMPVPPSICRRLLRSSASRCLLHFLVCSSVVCFTFATASASLYTRICFTFATASASLSRLLFSHLLHFCHNVCFTFATASASLLPQRLLHLLPQRLLRYCLSLLVRPCLLHVLLVLHLSMSSIEALLVIDLACDNRQSVVDNREKETGLYPGGGEGGGGARRRLSRRHAPPHPPPPAGLAVREGPVALCFGDPECLVWPTPSVGTAGPG